MSNYFSVLLILGNNLIVRKLFFKTKHIVFSSNNSHDCFLLNVTVCYKILDVRHPAIIEPLTPDNPLYTTQPHTHTPDNPHTHTIQPPTLDKTLYTNTSLYTKQPLTPDNPQHRQPLTPELLIGSIRPGVLAIFTPLKLLWSWILNSCDQYFCHPTWLNEEHLPLL